jgi:AcrR family transcriptional regulator
MATRSSILSTAEVRRDTVIAAAVSEFALTGYLGTPVASVAARAKISPAYVFKLFPSKESLFVAALDHCMELTEAVLAEGADAAPDTSPDAVLYSMGGAYAQLVADRELLMLQVHAQAAAGVPEIGLALRRGIKRLTEFSKSRSGASDAAVQNFLARGQLCHLLVASGIEPDAGDWARLLNDGIRHPA